MSNPPFSSPLVSKKRGKENLKSIETLTSLLEDFPLDSSPKLKITKKKRKKKKRKKLKLIVKTSDQRLVEMLVPEKIKISKLKKKISSFSILKKFFLVITSKEGFGNKLFLETKLKSYKRFVCCQSKILPVEIMSSYRDLNDILPTNRRFFSNQEKYLKIVISPCLDTETKIIIEEKVLKNVKWRKQNPSLAKRVNENYFQFSLDFFVQPFQTIVMIKTKLLNRIFMEDWGSHDLKLFKIYETYSEERQLTRSGPQNNLKPRKHITDFQSLLRTNSRGITSKSSRSISSVNGKRNGNNGFLTDFREKVRVRFQSKRSVSFSVMSKELVKLELEDKFPLDFYDIKNENIIHFKIFHKHTRITSPETPFPEARRKLSRKDSFEDTVKISEETVTSVGEIFVEIFKAKKVNDFRDFRVRMKIKEVEEKKCENFFVFIEFIKQFNVLKNLRDLNGIRYDSLKKHIFYLNLMILSRIQFEKTKNYKKGDPTENNGEKTKKLTKICYEFLDVISSESKGGTGPAVMLIESGLFQHEKCFEVIDTGILTDFLLRTEKSSFSLAPFSVKKPLEKIVNFNVFKEKIFQKLLTVKVNLRKLIETNKRVEKEFRKIPFFSDYFDKFENVKQKQLNSSSVSDLERDIATMNADITRRMQDLNKTMNRIVSAFKFENYYYNNFLFGELKYYGNLDNSGKFQGIGKLFRRRKNFFGIFKYKLVYFGEFEDGKFHGRGRLYFSSGAFKNGESRPGMATGGEKIQFYGKFHRNKKNGLGIEYAYPISTGTDEKPSTISNSSSGGSGTSSGGGEKSNQIIKRKGEWKNGKFVRTVSNGNSTGFSGIRKIDMTKFKNDVLFSDAKRKNYFIGEGSFSSVYVYKNKYAFKHMKIQNLTVEKKKEFMNEITILSCLNHENIIKIVGVSVNFPYGIVTELCSVSVQQMIKRSEKDKKVIEFEKKKRILQQTCLGMEYLHLNHHFHRDLKWENVMFDSSGMIKLIDFGFAKINESFRFSNIHSIKGTPGKMAPEMLNFTGKFDKKIDIFSFGIMIFELIAQTIDCFNLKTKPMEFLRNLNMNIANGLRPSLKFFEKRTKALGVIQEERVFYSKLMRLCWQRDPKKRPSFTQVISLFHSKNFEKK